MKKQLFKVLSLAALSFVTWSCGQSDPEPEGDFAQGVFVINEGNFSQNNGAISFFSRELTSLNADVFNSVNGVSFAGGGQGYTVTGSYGIILVDNSAAGLDKVQLVDPNTFESLGTIGAPDIENPREVVGINGTKAYVSCWGTNADYSYSTGYIAVVDLASKKVTSKIAIPGGPENIVVFSGKAYVGKTSYGSSTSLAVINTTTDAVETNITTAGGAPAPIGIDADNKLWVGAGIKAYGINPSNNQIEGTLDIGTDPSKSAGNFALSADKRTVFFTLTSYDSNYNAHGATYKFGTNDTSINLTTPVINRLFSGLAVDPAQGLIYAGVTPSYTQAGYAVRYRTDGSVVDSIKVGVVPTGFYFR